jgi:HEPN domain-containing protein
MPLDKEIPGSPREWLLRAKSDLAFARAPLPEGAFYEDLCFHIQQAAEKAIKAVYQYNGWKFRYTHNLEELLTGLKRHGLEIPPEVDDADVLTDYAWGARYPRFGEPVTEDEYRVALRQAETVVTWAEKHIVK